MSLPKWIKLSQKTIFTNKHWKYNLDKFQIESEQLGEYHYVHSPGSTMVVPFISNDKLLLVNQFRYLNQKESWEFPCGSIEEGLTNEQNALKELREESGYSGHLTRIGEFSPYTGVADEICTVFIAQNLFNSPLLNDDTEDFEIIEISIEDFEKQIKENTIWDGLTLSAWMLAKKYLDI